MTTNERITESEITDDAMLDLSEKIHHCYGMDSKEFKLFSDMYDLIASHSRQWISVEDELPDFDLKNQGVIYMSSDCLVIVQYESGTTQSYVSHLRENTKTGHVSWLGNFDGGRVIKWMPLPPKDTQ